MSCADEEGCFTITWEIENFDIFLRAEDGRLSSTAWKTETAEGSAVWWQVLANHCRTGICFGLICSNETWSLDSWKPSVISSCGKILPILSSWFSTFPSTYFVTYKKDVFCYLKPSNIPLNCLTFQCKMWQNSMKNGGFRIHSVIKKVIFYWCLEDSLFFSPSSSPYSQNKIIEKDNVRINMSFNFKGANEEYYICALALPIAEGCFSFVDCDVVWDWKATTQQCRSVDNNDLRTEHREEWKIVKRSGAICNTSCKITLLLDTIVAHHNCQYQIAYPTSCPIAKTGCSSEAVSDPLCKDLLQLYRESLLSDATLNTEGKAFPAHRSILAARSPVFRAMFEKDEMSEGRSGVVDIDDVDSETVGRMLVFLYGDSLQGLQWGEAASLYYAADKYAVQPLKQKCADILKAGLTVDNVCDALVLADTHSDEHLMKCAVDFINDHQEVVSLPKFEQLEDIKPRLTSKVVKELFLKREKK